MRLAQLIILLRMLSMSVPSVGVVSILHQNLHIAHSNNISMLLLYPLVNSSLLPHLNLLESSLCSNKSMDVHSRKILYSFPYYAMSLLNTIHDSISAKFLFGLYRLFLVLILLILTIFLFLTFIICVKFIILILVWYLIILNLIS